MATNVEALCGLVWHLDVAIDVALATTSTSSTSLKEAYIGAYLKLGESSSKLFLVQGKFSFDI